MIGKDAQALAATAARMQGEGQSHWLEIAPGLEDVFISLMQDDRGAK